MSSKKSETIMSDEFDFSKATFAPSKDRAPAATTSRPTFTVAEKQEKIQLGRRPQQEVRQRQPQPQTLHYQRGQAMPQGQQGITVGKTGFTDQLALILGGVYGVGAAFGILAALRDAITSSGIKKRRYVISSRVQISRRLTEGFKIVSNYGNTTAAIGLLYMLLSKATTYIFQEELEYVPKPVQHSIFGFMAGALCKSINGFKPAILAGTMGSIAAPLSVACFSRFSQFVRI